MKFGQRKFTARLATATIAAMILAGPAQAQTRIPPGGGGYHGAHGGYHGWGGGYGGWHGGYGYYGGGYYGGALLGGLALGAIAGAVIANNSYPYDGYGYYYGSDPVPAYDGCYEAYDCYPGQRYYVPPRLRYRAYARPPVYVGPSPASPEPISRRTKSRSNGSRTASDGARRQASAMHSISRSNSIGQDATGTKVRDGGSFGK